MKTEKPKYRCRDCKYAKDFHEKNMEGEFFLCRCKFFTTSRFLNLDWCEKFERR
jgi:hypothetical protein